MKKIKNICLQIIPFIILFFIMGCTGSSNDFNETKLDVEEGVGVVGTLKIDELNPGLEGYISLTIRSNLGGGGSSNVIIGIDNIPPFQIIECGAQQKDVWALRTCSGQLDQDMGIPYRMRSTAKLFPGEELDVFWRIKAPSHDEISDISLKHAIYYNVEYDYKTSLHQSIFFMSQDEVIRRRQLGEEYLLEGESGSSAGELRFKSATQQPIVYFFDKEMGQEANFSFALQYLVENKGTGFPLSDLVLLVQYPGGNIMEPDSTTYNTYGWYKWDDAEVLASCYTGDFKNPTMNCKEWVADVFGDDFKNMDTDKVLIKVLRRTDFFDSFSVYVPMVMSGSERTRLRDGNIPLNIYSFNVHAMYRYFIEGKEYIEVFPIRAI